MKKIFISKGFSNIALIKYWGKYKNQIPANISMSFTLKKCYSKSKIIFEPKKNKKNTISIKLFFSGKRNIKFVKKIKIFFKKILPYCPYLNNYKFIIKTINSFPHSSGLASSASAISSLSLSIIKYEKYILKNKLNKKYFLRKASFIARLGSGSACRSIYPGLVMWGKHKNIINSSNKYAIPYPYKIHKIFMQYYDTILIVDSKEKKISSSDGHLLMKKNPYSKIKFKISNQNFETIISILKSGDIENFGKIIENEAFHLHAMLMTSNPSLLLIKPNTLNIINHVINFREETKIPLYFTLDAGSNVHLLYPLTEYYIIKKFIKDYLLIFCEKKLYIEDTCCFKQ